MAKDPFFGSVLSVANRQMRGLLVRVGIDLTDGRWNAPMRSTPPEFAYVTITEDTTTKQLRPGMSRLYDEFALVVNRFGQQLPSGLLGAPTHLDPDFQHLTYGDQGQRGAKISTLASGDLLAFFASFCPVDRSPRPLAYALIGLYVIDEIVDAALVSPERWHENAHTRWVPSAVDIVVRAKPKISGRLRYCLSIGEYRKRAYRVRTDLLNAWGGLDVKDGYIQRSARLPEFSDARRFYQWFLAQSPELLAENNPI